MNKRDCITGRIIRGEKGFFEYQKRHPNNMKMDVEMNIEEVEFDE